MKKLFELENYFLNTNISFFDPDKIPSRATRESDTRERLYIRELTITCPDEIDRLFSWHLRMTPGAGRLHFYPLVEERKIIVGYIGKKIGI